jgi:hypothetical protein
MRTQYTVKHLTDSASLAKRQRTDQGVEEAGAAYDECGVNEDGGVHYEYALTEDVDVERDHNWDPEDPNE